MTNAILCTRELKTEAEWRALEQLFDPKPYARHMRDFISSCVSEHPDYTPQDVERAMQISGEFDMIEIPSVERIAELMHEADWLETDSGNSAESRRREFAGDHSFRGDIEITVSPDADTDEVRLSMAIEGVLDDTGFMRADDVILDSGQGDTYEGTIEVTFTGTDIDDARAGMAITDAIKKIAPWVVDVAMTLEELSSEVASVREQGGYEDESGDWSFSRDHYINYIKCYVRDHPNCTAEDVARAMNISGEFNVPITIDSVAKYMTESVRESFRIVYPEYREVPDYVMRQWADDAIADDEIKGPSTLPLKELALQLQDAGLITLGSARPTTVSLADTEDTEESVHEQDEDHFWDERELGGDSVGTVDGLVRMYLLQDDPETEDLTLRLQTADGEIPFEKTLVASKDDLTAALEDARRFADAHNFVIAYEDPKMVTQWAQALKRSGVTRESRHRREAASWPLTLPAGWQNVSGLLPTIQKIISRGGRREYVKIVYDTKTGVLRVQSKVPSNKTYPPTEDGLRRARADAEIVAAKESRNPKVRRRREILTPSMLAGTYDPSAHPTPTGPAITSDPREKVRTYVSFPGWKFAPYAGHNTYYKESPKSRYAVRIFVMPDGTFDAMSYFRMRGAQQSPSGRQQFMNIQDAIKWGEAYLDAPYNYESKLGRRNAVQ